MTSGLKFYMALRENKMSKYMETKKGSLEESILGLWQEAAKKQTSDSIQLDGDKMISEGQDVVQVALDVATQELNPSGETNFAKIDFADGSSQNLDNFSAKRIAAAYAGLEGEQQKQYQYMLNKDASTFQSALDFAIRSV